MGIRITGGVGPVHASIPVRPPRGTLPAFIAIFWLPLYWLGIWPMKLLFWDLPRAILRARARQH